MNLGNLVAEYLFSDDNKAKIVSELNKNVNIPIINEKTEAKMIETIYEVFEQVIRASILKK